MKRILMAVIALIATLLLISCGGTNDSSTDTGTDTGASEKASYTIKWVDEKGNEILSESVESGKTPSMSYTVSDTDEWDYTFCGWALSANGEILDSIPQANEDKTYYAVVSRIKKIYKVTFDTQGAGEIASQSLEYGTVPTKPEDPKMEGYRFVGWSTHKDGETSVDFTKAITQNVTYYAIWNKVIDVKGLLEALLTGYEFNPYLYIPESLRPDFSASLVDANGIIDDYSDFVDVSDIKYGFGEQWQMVLGNLEESLIFFNVLSVIESISATSITVFNNYFDENPSDTARHEFDVGIYSVTVDFDGEIISYILNFTTELPLFGEQTIQLCMSMSAETSERFARIQIGDANALAYKVTENSYEFAIKYAESRRAMFSIERDEDGNTYGKIYEFIGTSTADIISSAAEFYFTNEYASIIGNKADGMLGFEGYISELYRIEDGALLGYEVKESLLGVLEFNTLWFNLDDISGVSSIKYIPKDGENEAKIYINDLSSLWETKKVGVINSSRRFDIEMRTQYVYSYDAKNEKYIVHQIMVPMMFVQEEYLDTFESDVSSANDVNVSIDVDEDDIDKIIEDYKMLVPIFEENKDNTSSEDIVEYIGEKKELK